MRYKEQEFSRRERCILDTAATLYAERDWERVTVAELADRAGIGKGTVYKHFGSKEEILARLVIDFEQQCLNEYWNIARQAPPLTALRRIFRKAFDLFLEFPARARMSLFCFRADFRQRLGAGYQQAFLELEQAYFDLFGHILRQAIEQGSLQEQPVQRLFVGLLATFEGAMNRLAGQGIALSLEPVEREAYLEGIVDFMLAGILGMPAADAVRDRLCEQGKNH